MKKIYGLVLVGLLASATMVCATDELMEVDKVFSPLSTKLKMAVGDEMHQALDALGLLLDEKHRANRLTAGFCEWLDGELEKIPTLAEQIYYLNSIDSTPGVLSSLKRVGGLDVKRVLTDFSRAGKAPSSDAPHPFGEKVASSDALSTAEPFRRQDSAEPELKSPLHPPEDQ